MTSDKLDAAIAWQVRLSDGVPEPETRQAFEHWLAADAAHAQAWLQLQSGVSHTVGRLEPVLGRHAPLREALLQPGQTRRQFMRRALGLGAVGVGAAWLWDRQMPLPNLLADISTGTAQRKDFTLPDGSRVKLDARSRADLAFTDQSRTLHLLAGAVYVETAHDAQRPFIVRTAQGWVQALGTAFMVRQLQDESLVVVQQHQVRVSTLAGKQEDVAQGHGVRFDASDIVALGAELRGEYAWQDGMLEVHGRSLAEVIDLFRPYYAGVLRVSPDVAQIRVSGVYPLDDLPRALRALAYTTPIQVRQLTPWVTLIEATAS